jgi:Phytanoyl-CoA dioxygenase (PhyH)
MIDSNSSSFDRNGLTLHKNLLPGGLIRALRSSIDSKFEQIESTMRGGRSVNEVMSSPEQYVPTASSFTIGAAIPQSALDVVLARIADAPTGQWIQDELENEVACDLDQSWVRRQYAPSRYPQFHAPHGWHQDGALKFDFAAHQPPFPNALLEMVTCWITLDTCGEHAPGLEIVIQKLDGLLAPVELTNESVQKRFLAEKLWQPKMDAGDALLFPGNYLHRTHVAATMTNDRTSIELRFFMKNRIPRHLQFDRFVELR